MPTAQQVEQAIHATRDQASFLQKLLAGALNWPIEPQVQCLEDISYGWSADELRAEGLDKHVIDGHVCQIQPLQSNQPWGIFLLEFKNPELFATGRGMTGPLRKVLRGLVPSRRRDSKLAAWHREDLLFICTHNYTHYRFAYFKAPAEGTKTAPLAMFGWGPDIPARTACEWNLPALQWPQSKVAAEEWIERWSAAFDVEKVTTQFYENYKAAFEHVEKLIKRQGDLKTAEDIRIFTQTLFNRLMFLRFVERKGWMEFKGSRNYLLALHGAGGIGRKSLFQSRIRPLFFEGLAVAGHKNPEIGTVPFLNGGLFEPSELDSKVKDIPDEAFNLVIGKGGLFYRYNFTVEESTPLDIEVAVDPEMLGMVFEELVTGRHETGSYYTPRPIVSFMCREAIKGYLADRTKASAKAIASLVDKHEVEGLTESDGRAILAALDELKAMDPACGSGAYLLGLLQELVAIYRLLQSEKLVKDTRSLYQLKLRIISHSLYGVDIDPFATNIAMLRLWLAIAVDAAEPLPLPNLDFKIETGDTLLGPCEVPQSHFDFHDLRQRADALIVQKDKYLKASGAEKERAREQIRRVEGEIANDIHGQYRKGVIDWRVQFAEVFAPTRQLEVTMDGKFGFVADVKAQKEFKVTADFGTGGFDIVLANPPYISAIEFRRHYPDEQRAALKAQYLAAKGAYDIYVLFFERAIQLLAPRGRLAFITPNKYLSANYAVALRDVMRKNTALVGLADLSRIPVFASASVYPVLTFLRKGTETKYDIHLWLPTTNEMDEFDVTKYKTLRLPSGVLTLLPDNVWGFMLSPEATLLEKMVKNASPLGLLAEVCASTTAAEADEYGEYLTEKAAAGNLKVVNTGTIDPFQSLWGEVRLTHQGSQYLQPYLPQSKVSERRAGIYASPKLIFAKMAKECEACLDGAGEYASLNTNCLYAIKCDVPLEYFAGFCHSPIFHFLYNQFFGALRMSGGYFQFQAPQLRVIPMRIPDKDSQRRVVAAVEKMMGLIGKGRTYDSPDVVELRQRINATLYELYGLTKEEVASIERMQ